MTFLPQLLTKADGSTLLDHLYHESIAILERHVQLFTNVLRLRVSSGLDDVIGQHGRFT